MGSFEGAASGSAGAACLDRVLGRRGAGVCSPAPVARAAALVGALAGFAAPARGVVAFGSAAPPSAPAAVGSAAARRAAALAAGAPICVTSIRVSSWRWPVRRR